MPHQSADVYQLGRIRGTPYPNRLLDLSLTLPETQLRIVNLVVRSTLGWYGGSPGTRRASAYFGYGYLMHRVGRSSREAIHGALVELASAGVIEAVDTTGAVLPMSVLAQPYRRGVRLRLARPWVEEPTAATSG
jgi:hypothetical protein